MERFSIQTREGELLTDYEGSNGDGNECLVRMEGSCMWLQRSHATTNVAQVKVLQCPPLHAEVVRGPRNCEIAQRNEQLRF